MKTQNAQEKKNDFFSDLKGRWRKREQITQETFTMETDKQIALL